MLAGANTFQGNITLTNGNLALTAIINASNVPITSPLGNAANQLIINPGVSSIRFVYDEAWDPTSAIPVPNPNVINQNATLIPWSAAIAFMGIFTGVISGMGGITMQNYLSAAATPLISIQNAATFTGPLIDKLFTGGLSVSGTIASSNVTTGGTLTTTDIRLYPRANCSRTTRPPTLSIDFLPRGRSFSPIAVRSS